MRQPGDRAPAPEGLALVQDLANTIDIEMERDALRTVEDLATFCATHGIDGLALDESDVAGSRRLREALRDVCQAHAGADISPATMTVLDDLLTAAPLRLVIDAAGHVEVKPVSGLDGLPALTARIACR